MNAKRTWKFFYEEKANGLIVRARARWHEYGEKSTKYFLSLEKRNYTRKHIRKLCLSGVITKSHQKILESASEYYKNLYSSKLKVDQSDSLDHFLGNSNIPRLSQEEGLSCEGQITLEECVKALDTFDTGIKRLEMMEFLLNFINFSGILLVS